MTNGVPKCSTQKYSCLMDLGSYVKLNYSIFMLLTWKRHILKSEGGENHWLLKYNPISYAHEC